MNPETPEARLARFWAADESPEEIRETLAEEGYDVEAIESQARTMLRRMRAEARRTRAEARLAWFQRVADEVRAGLSGQDVAAAYQERFGPLPDNGPLAVAFRRLREGADHDPEAQLRDLFLLQTLAMEADDEDPAHDPGT